MVHAGGDLDAKRTIDFAKSTQQCELSDAITAPIIAEQKRAQHTQARIATVIRTFQITEGRACSVQDLDNCTKPTLDAISKNQLVWHDDRTIPGGRVFRNTVWRGRGQGTDLSLSMVVSEP